MKKILAIFALALAVLIPSTASAATYDWEATPTVKFRLWIPDGVPVVKGIYYHFNESGTDGRVYAGKFRMQNWAKTMGFAIIGTYWTGDAPGGNTAAALTAISELGKLSSHPELVNAPILAEGISYGGYNSMAFAAAYPSKTIAYLSGASSGIPVSTNPQFLLTPGLIYRGDKDPDLANAMKRRDQVITMRQGGAQVAYWIQWNYGHEYGYADDMGLKFLSDVVRLRYPAGASPATGPIRLNYVPSNCAWLADWNTWENPITSISSYLEFPGAPNNAFWLPNKDFAYVYRAHATKVLPVTLTMTGNNEINPGVKTTLTAVAPTLTNISSVDFYDGATLISKVNATPYTVTWTAAGLGPHSIVAVANLSDGTKRTGYSVNIMVLGNGSPESVGVASTCTADPPPPPVVDAGVTPPPSPDAAPVKPIDASAIADAGLVCEPCACGIIEYDAGPPCVNPSDATVPPPPVYDATPPAPVYDASVPVQVYDAAVASNDAAPPVVYDASVPTPTPDASPTPPKPPSSCGSCGAGGTTTVIGLLLTLVLIGIMRRRR